MPTAANGIYVEPRNAVACGDLSRSLVPSTAATSPSTTLIPRAASCFRCSRPGRGAVQEQGHIGPPLTPHQCLRGGFPGPAATSRLHHSQHSWRSGLIASLVPVIFDRSPAHLRRRWLSVIPRPATFAGERTAHSVQDKRWPSAEPRAHWLAFSSSRSAGKCGRACSRKTAAWGSSISASAALWLSRRVRWSARRPGSLRPIIWVVWPAIVAVGKLVIKG